LRMALLAQHKIVSVQASDGAVVVVHYLHIHAQAKLRGQRRYQAFAACLMNLEASLHSKVKRIDESNQSR
jgi:hypothetical protein